VGLPDECVDHCLGVFALYFGEHHIASMTFDQGCEIFDSRRSCLVTARKAELNQVLFSEGFWSGVGQQPPNFNCFLRVVQSVQMGA
jgi:hypothetical protein